MVNNYIVFERFFAVDGFIALGAALSQTNPNNGGASLLYFFTGIVVCVCNIFFLAFSSGTNPFNKALIKGFIMTCVSVFFFSALVIGVQIYGAVGALFATTAILYYFEPLIDHSHTNVQYTNAHIGTVVSTPLHHADSWKKHFWTRSSVGR